MGISTWIAIGVIVLIVGLAAGYVIKSKKKGSKFCSTKQKNLHNLQVFCFEKPDQMEQTDLSQGSGSYPASGKNRSAARK